jgi:hypothetical protein
MSSTPFSYEAKAQAEGDKQIVPITVEQTFINENGKKRNEVLCGK